MKKNIFISALLLVMALPSAGWSLSTITLTGSQDEYNLGGDMEFIEDPSGLKTLSEIRDSAGWVRSAATVPNFGITRSSYWGRIALDNTVPGAEWYFELSFPSIDYVDLYVQGDKGGTVQFHTGDRLPFDRRDVPNRAFVFKLNLDKGRYVLYMRTQTQGTMIIPVAIRSRHNFQSLALDDIILGIYFGIMAAMFFYNLFLYVSLRDRSYLYYILYMACFILYQTSETGLASQYMVPRSPDVANDMTHVLYIAVELFVLLFTRQFLSLKKTIPVFNRIYTVLIALHIPLLLVIDFFNHHTRMLIAVPLAFLVIPFILATGIIAMVRGYRPAVYFVIAWMVFVIASLLANAELSGLLPTFFFFTNGIRIGNALEAVLLSLALAYRIDLLQKENIRIGIDVLKKEHQLDMISNEMEIARQIQNSILPKIPSLEPHFKISAIYTPMASIGGDMYDFYEIDDGRLGAIVADVSGHGMPAALVSSMVKMTFSMHIQIARDPVLVLDEMNSSLLSKCGEGFVTAGYCYIDRRTGTISYASAGHVPLVIFKRREGRCVLMESRGRAMGIAADIECNIVTANVENGDRIILYTDGITECRNEGRDFFGEERLVDFIIENRDATAEAFCSLCMNRLTLWTGSKVFDDDITLVVIDVL